MQITTVFGNTTMQFMNKMDELLNSFPKEDVLEVMKTEDTYEIYLKNGDQYLGYDLSIEVCRGRYHRAFVPRIIDRKLLFFVVYSMLYESHLPKEQLIIYY